MNPWPRNLALKILAGIWSFPVAFVGFVITGGLVLLRQARSLGWNDGAWDLVACDGSGLAAYRKQWGGFSVGWCVVYLTENESKDVMTRHHERVHIRQQLRLSVFHWLFYGLFVIVVWVSCPSLHSYAANPFELDARLQSGDAIGNLGPEKGGDRFPWW